MDKPLTHWYCDSCGKQIKEAADGIVVWRRERGLVTEHRIVHRGQCDIPELPASENLSEFLGPDGLVKLTAFFTRGRILTLHGEDEENEVLDASAFAELIRRLHVPHYEEARRHFDSPELYDRYADGGEVAPYMQEALKALIENGCSDS